MRWFNAIHNQRARPPIATLAVAALVGALSIVSLPTAPAAASVKPARPGVPAAFYPVASTFVPHSSMAYVLGSTAEKTAPFRRYEVLRIYHGKTSYTVVTHTRHDAITSIAAGSASAV